MGKPRSVEFREYLQQARERSMQRDTKYWSPLDLHTLLLPSLSKKMEDVAETSFVKQARSSSVVTASSSIYWKLILSVDENDAAGDWVAAKLSRGRVFTKAGDYIEDEKYVLCQYLCKKLTFLFSFF